MAQYVKFSRNVVEQNKLFRTNEEYLLVEQISKRVGCGSCGSGRKNALYYRIEANGKTYDIHSQYATLVNRTVPLNPMSPEEFHTSMRGTLETNAGTNYDAIRNNNNPDDIIANANNVPM